MEKQKSGGNYPRLPDFSLLDAPPPLQGTPRFVEWRGSARLLLFPPLFAQVEMQTTARSAHPRAAGRVSTRKMYWHVGSIAVRVMSGAGEV